MPASAWGNSGYRLWLPSQNGRFFDIPEVGVAPKPARKDIPIWIGGHTPRAMRRVAELGDGWHAAFATPDVMKKGILDLEAACEKAGRDPAQITLSVRLGFATRRSSAEVLEELQRLRDVGVSHVIVETRVASAADMIALLDRFAAEVRAKL